jgi:hypothetical protein
MATYRKPRTKMGSVTGTTPTGKGIAIPGTVRATIQDLARRSANRKAPPARAIERAGQFSPSPITTLLQQSHMKKKDTGTLLEAYKKKAAAKKKKKATKKKTKKKKGGKLDKLVRKIKKYGIKN